MTKEFVYIVNLFFQDEDSFIYFNGNMTLAFKIKRWVRQRCPCAPCLFLLVGKILNLVKQAINSGEIRGILNNTRRQKETNPLLEC
jgi:hypothetical protein